MTVGYISYLVFQLGSHKDEFDYNGDEYAVFGGGHNIIRTPSSKSKRKKSPTRQNLFCKRYCFFTNYCPRISKDESYNVVRYGSDENDCERIVVVEENSSDGEEGFMMETQTPQSLVQTQRKVDVRSSPESFTDNPQFFKEKEPQCSLKSKCSDLQDDGTSKMNAHYDIIYFISI
jgi:hypothetical protein